MDTDYSEHNTEASVAADLAIRQTRYEHGKDGVPLEITEGNIRVMGELMPEPLRIEQSVDIHSLDGLRDYLTLYRSEQTRIFSQDCNGSKSFKAILDYHEIDSPSWCSHVALFMLKYDPRFEAWKEYFNNWMDQEAFIDLLENNESALINPTSTAMLELAANLEFNMKSRVVSKRNSQNGAVELGFESEEGAGSTVLPPEIEIGVPIFKGFKNKEGKLQAHKIRVRLRYRIADGKARFQLLPVNLIDILDDAWADAVGLVNSWDLAPVIEGSPGLGSPLR